MATPRCRGQKRLLFVIYESGARASLFPKKQAGKLMVGFGASSFNSIRCCENFFSWCNCEKEFSEKKTFPLEASPWSGNKQKKILAILNCFYLEILPRSLLFILPRAKWNEWKKRGERNYSGFACVWRRRADSIVSFIHRTSSSLLFSRKSLATRSTLSR